MNSVSLQKPMEIKKKKRRYYLFKKFMIFESFLLFFQVPLFMVSECLYMAKL